MEYFDEAGIIKADLLDTKALETAKSFVKYEDKFNKKTQRKEKKLAKGGSLTSSQLRRFFNEFRQLEKKVRVDDFPKVLPLIKMVKSKASYAANRSQSKIPKSFKEFLVNNINMINSKDDFVAFMLFFEAIVGFFYGLEGVKNE